MRCVASASAEASDPVAVVLAACDASTAPEARSPGTVDDAPTATGETPDERDAAKAPVTPDDLATHLGQTIQIEGRNLRIQKGTIDVQVPWLKARLEPAGEVVVLSDPASFDVVLDGLDLRVRAQELLGPYMDGGPVDDATLRTEGDAILVDASLDVLSVPLKLKAVPGVVEGRVKLDVEEAKALGIGIKPFLDLIEQKPEDVPGLLQVEGDRIYVDPSDLPGATDVTIDFDRADVVGDTVVMQVGEPPTDDLPDDGSLTLAGGTLQTGNTVLFGMDITLVMRDGGALTIAPDGFDQQVQEGFSEQHDGPRLTLNLAPPPARERAGTPGE